MGKLRGRLVPIPPPPPEPVPEPYYPEIPLPLWFFSLWWQLLNWPDDLIQEILVWVHAHKRYPTREELAAITGVPLERITPAGFYLREPYGPYPYVCNLLQAVVYLNRCLSFWRGGA